MSSTGTGNRSTQLMSDVRAMQEAHNGVWRPGVVLPSTGRTWLEEAWDMYCRERVALEEQANVQPHVGSIQTNEE